jgi:Integrase core domain
VPSGNHKFDKACTSAAIEHRLIPPRHPQTNGMVERFNGRISEIVQQTRFPSLQVLVDTVHNYVGVYNRSIPQRALKHQTPVQTLKVSVWQKSNPELFNRREYNHRGLDSYAVLWGRELLRRIGSGNGFRTV